MCSLISFSQTEYTQLIGTQIQDQKTASAPEAPFMLPSVVAEGGSRCASLQWQRFACSCALCEYNPTVCT